MRIQTRRTPSGVRFVFVSIFHAPRSCMIGQQGSLGRAEHAREKGGFYFFFFITIGRTSLCLLPAVFCARDFRERVSSFVNCPAWYADCFVLVLAV